MSPCRYNGFGVVIDGKLDAGAGQRPGPSSSEVSTKKGHDKQGVGCKLQPIPASVPQRLPQDEALKNVYDGNKEFILRPHEASDEAVTALYKFPVNDPLSPNELASYINRVYSYEPSAFKIDVCLATILRHRWVNIDISM